MMLPKSVEAWLVELGSTRILPESSRGNGGNEVVFGITSRVVEIEGLMANTMKKMEKMEVVLSILQRKIDT